MSCKSLNSLFYLTISLVLGTLALPANAPGNGIEDIYETDDMQDDSTVIVLNDIEPQLHTFHVGTDTDWIKLFSIQDQSYEVRVQNTSPNCDVVLQVIEADGTVIGIDDFFGPDEQGLDEYHSWQSTQNGFFYASVSPWSGNQLACEGASYEIVAFIPSLPTLALFTGTITNSLTGAGVGDAILVTSDSFSAISLVGSGNYEMPHSPIESSDLFIYADGYDTLQTTISVPDADTTVPLDLSLQPTVALEHAIVALKVLAGFSANGIQDLPDLYSDGQIGMPEAIYVMQRLTSVRE